MTTDLSAWKDRIELTLKVQKQLSLETVEMCFTELELRELLIIIETLADFLIRKERQV